MKVLKVLRGFMYNDLFYLLNFRVIKDFMIQGGDFVNVSSGLPKIE